LEEVNLLLGVLKNKFHLNCYISKDGSGKGRYLILISSKSLSSLQQLLEPIMPSMMRYKIGL
jgi:hypothetical protein